MYELCYQRCLPLMELVVEGVNKEWQQLGGRDGRRDGGRERPTGAEEGDLG